MSCMVMITIIYDIVQASHRAPEYQFKIDPLTRVSSAGKGTSHFWKLGSRISAVHLFLFMLKDQ